MESRWQRLYSRFVVWMARKSWRSCLHGKDVVLCIEGPYPMCPLCCEQVLRNLADQQIEEYAKRLEEYAKRLAAVR